MRVQLVGAETSDGRITERFIAIEGPEASETIFLDAAAARVIAAHLPTAVDEWESLTE